MHVCIILTFNVSRASSVLINGQFYWFLVSKFQGYSSLMSLFPDKLFWQYPWMGSDCHQKVLPDIMCTVLSIQAQEMETTQSKHLSWKRYWEEGQALTQVNQFVLEIIQWSTSRSIHLFLNQCTRHFPSPALNWDIGCLWLQKLTMLTLSLWRLRYIVKLPLSFSHPKKQHAVFW